MKAIEVTGKIDAQGNLVLDELIRETTYLTTSFIWATFTIVSNVGRHYFPMKESLVMGFYKKFHNS